MDTTTHTTNTVEFVDWRAKAKEKLEAEDKQFRGSREAMAVESYVLRTLLSFVEQEPRFAEVICGTTRTFSECCAAVVHGAGEMISDLDAYRKAVQFYFPNAEIAFVMNIKLTGAAPTAEEMQKPAQIQPKEQPKSKSEKPEAKKEEPKPEKNPPKPKKQEKKAKKAVEDDSMQLSLEGWF